MVLRTLRKELAAVNTRRPCADRLTWLTEDRSLHPRGSNTPGARPGDLSSTPSRGLWDDTAPPAPPTGPIQGPLTAQVAVIGAGYTGLSAALHLALAGVSTVVLEARDVGFGGSGRNVGLVNAGMWISPDEVASTLGAPYGDRLLNELGDAPAYVFELIERHGIACEVERRGTLHCALGRSGLADLERRAAQWTRRGAPVELLGAGETAAKLGTDLYAGSLWDHRAGTIQPLAYARGLARASLAAGARIFTQSPVLSTHREGAEWRVVAEHGSVRAAWILAATDAYTTGPWAAIAREQVPLPYFNLSTAPLDPTLLASLLPGRQGAWDTQAVLNSFRLDAAGRLIFGSIGALEGAGKPIHTSWAERAVRRIFPQLGAARFERGWYGTIGMTADRLPRFHELAPNAIAFCGYNGRGIAPGTAFGRLAAAYITGACAKDDLPLPLTEVRSQPLRGMKQAMYSLGSQAVHWMQGRL
jgi:glycine/D-amino acid oxidase-like deaminating enzyme